MTQYIDKTALVAEIERLKAEALQKKSQCKRSGFEKIMHQIGVYNKILSFIDSLQEEPVSEELEKIVEEIAEPTILNAYGTKELARRLRNTVIYGTSISKELEEASKEWLAPQLDKSYANYGEAKMMELTHFDGYAMLDAIEFGAKWQKEQMMKDLPKWKKVCPDVGQTILYQDGTNIHLQRFGYEIDLKELDKLPKDE